MDEITVIYKFELRQRKVRNRYFVKKLIVE